MPGWLNYRFVSRSYKIWPDTVLSTIWKLKIRFSCKPSQFLIQSHLKMCIIRPNQIFCGRPLLSGHQTESVQWITKRHFWYLKEKQNHNRKNTFSLGHLDLHKWSLSCPSKKKSLYVYKFGCMHAMTRDKVSYYHWELSLKLPEIFLPLPPTVP